MVPVIKEQTKFKYNDKVIVKYGFYRGVVGKVTGYHPYSDGIFKIKKYLVYHLKLSDNNLDILVDEDQIEIVGHK